MSQLHLLEASAPPDLQPETVSKSKTKSKSRSSQSKQSNSSASAPKQIASSVIQVEVDIYRTAQPVPYGFCRTCSEPVKTPGLDHSLCSGACGWVINQIGLAGQGGAR